LGRQASPAPRPPQQGGPGEAHPIFHSGDAFFGSGVRPQIMYPTPRPEGFVQGRLFSRALGVSRGAERGVAWAFLAFGRLGPGRDGWGFFGLLRAGPQRADGAPLGDPGFPLVVCGTEGGGTPPRPRGLLLFFCCGPLGPGNFAFGAGTCFLRLFSGTLSLGPAFVFLRPRGNKGPPRPGPTFGAGPPTCVRNIKKWGGGPLLGPGLLSRFSPAGGARPQGGKWLGILGKGSTQGGPMGGPGRRGVVVGGHGCAFCPSGPGGNMGAAYPGAGGPPSSCFYVRKNCGRDTRAPPARRGDWICGGPGAGRGGQGRGGIHPPPPRPLFSPNGRRGPPHARKMFLRGPPILGARTEGKGPPRRVAKLFAPRALFFEGGVFSSFRPGGQPPAPPKKRAGPLFPGSARVKKAFEKPKCPLAGDPLPGGPQPKFKFAARRKIDLAPGGGPLVAGKPPPRPRDLWEARPGGPAFGRGPPR